jgi:hypothetical protein
MIDIRSRILPLAQNLEQVLVLISLVITNQVALNQGITQLQDQIIQSQILRPIQDQIIILISSHQGRLIVHRDQTLIRILDLLVIHRHQGLIQVLVIQRLAEVLRHQAIVGVALENPVQVTVEVLALDQVDQVQAQVQADQVLQEGKDKIILYKT